MNPELSFPLSIVSVIIGLACWAAGDTNAGWAFTTLGPLALVLATIDWINIHDKREREELLRRYFNKD